MRKFELVINEASGEKYWSQEFDSKIELNRWLDAEKTRFYWKKEFVVEIVDNSEAIEKFEADRKARIEAEELDEKQKRTDARAAVKAFKDKPSKNIADVVKLLEVIVERLDLKPDDSAKG